MHHAPSASAGSAYVPPPSAARRPRVFLSDRTHIRIPSAIEMIDDVAELLARRAVESGACAEDKRGDLLLVFTEALINAVVHGNLEIPSSLKAAGDSTFARALAERSGDPDYADRAVDIQTHFNGSQIQWTITDEGPGFDVETHLRHIEQSSDTDSPSGRGILLMQALTDRLKWAMGGRQIQITVHSGQTDRRQGPRTAARLPLRMAPVDEDGHVDWSAAFEALAVNVGLGGLGIVHSHLPAASHVLIEIPAEHGPVLVPATVCSVQQTTPSMVQIGCRIDLPDTGEGVIEHDQARRSLGELVRRNDSPTPDHHEARRHVRTTYTRTIEVEAPGRPRQPQIARDLSVGGMAFLSQNAWDVGAAITVHFVQEDDRMPPIHATVVRCLRVADAIHDVGVRFT